ncbi:MAG: DUF6504 family protein [Nocardioidaceae bacterium]
MRTYGELIDVRRGLVSGQEAPEQFVWRGALWVVLDLIGHWIETSAWWEQADLAADLLGEREVWRVEAMRGHSGIRREGGAGVFDLACDWGRGQWQLVCSID